VKSKGKQFEVLIFCHDFAVPVCCSATKLK